MPKGRLEYASLAAQGAVMRPSVIFECVSVPGVIQAILEGAPSSARVVAVGVYMQTDAFEPSIGIMKEVDLRFVLGSTPRAYAQSLRAIAEGHIDVAPMVTQIIDLHGVAVAFDALANPTHNAKIIVVA